MAKQRQTFGDRMAVLKNARHERFSQLKAAGETQEEAYRKAGYKPDKGAASRLSRNVNIEARVATLLATTAVTVSSVTDALLRLAQKGEDIGDSAGLSVARLSWMDAAKLAGIVVDKAQVDQKWADVTDEPVSHDEAVSAYKAELERDGITVN